MENIQNPPTPIPGGTGHDESILTALKSDPFILSMFLSLLLIGGDVIAVRVGGLTLRVVFPLLMMSFAFLFQRIGGRIALDRRLTILFFVLALAAAASVMGSLDPVKSVGYTIWVFFDFFVIITLTYNFAALYSPALTLKLWFLIYRIHAVLLLAELMRIVFLQHSVVRPHLWFYETSFLAIFMTGYFGAALFMLLRSGKSYLWDFLLSLVAMIALSSATGFFAMLLAVALNFIVARQRVRLVLVTLLLFAVFFGTLFLFFRNSNYFKSVGGFLLNGDSLTSMFNLVLGRSGNRWIRAAVGWDAFLRHPWLGVGIGGDTAYMGASPFPESVAGYLRPWMDLDQGQPFNNILIEVAGTMGLAGLVPVFGILVYAVISFTKVVRGRQTEAAAYFMSFFAIFLALQFESTFLRYYLWTPLGLGLGVLAQTKKPPMTKPTQVPLQAPA